MLVPILALFLVLGLVAGGIFVVRRNQLRHALSRRSAAAREIDNILQDARIAEAKRHEAGR
jgi:hypothetical protein